MPLLLLEGNSLPTEAYVDEENGYEYDDEDEARHFGSTTRQVTHSLDEDETRHFGSVARTSDDRIAHRRRFFNLHRGSHSSSLRGNLA